MALSLYSTHFNLYQLIMRSFLLLALLPMAILGKESVVVLPLPGGKLPGVKMGEAIMEDSSSSKQGTGKGKIINNSLLSRHRMMTEAETERSLEEKDLFNSVTIANEAILEHLSSGAALPPSACSDRMAAIRGLVEAGKHKDALLASAALTADDKAKLEGCETEEFFDGLGELGFVGMGPPPSPSMIKNETHTPPPPPHPSSPSLGESSHLHACAQSLLQNRRFRDLTVQVRFSDHAVHGRSQVPHISRRHPSPRLHP